MDSDSDYESESGNSSHSSQRSSASPKTSKLSKRSRASSPGMSKLSRSRHNVEDLLNEAHSRQPKTKEASRAALTLTTTGRLQELALNGWTSKLLQKMFKGYSPNQKVSAKQATTISKLSKDVQHSGLTLTDVKVMRVRPIERSGAIQIDSINRVFFKLYDKIFTVSPARTREGTFNCAKRIFFVDNSKSLRDKGHLVCSLANVIEFNESRVGNKTCRVKGKDNSLIGEKYRVARNTEDDVKDDAKEECDNMMKALMTADSQNNLEIVAPYPADLLEIIRDLGVPLGRSREHAETFTEFLSNTDGTLMRGIDPEKPEETEEALLKGMKLTSEISRKRDIYVDDYDYDGGRKRRYSTKRRSLRKSRTVKKRK